MGWSAELTGMRGVQKALVAYEHKWGSFQRHVVISDVEYAVYVEFGTSNMPANMALRNAVSETLSNLPSMAKKAGSGDELSRMIAESIRDKWKEDVWVDTGRLRDSIHIERGD